MQEKRLLRIIEKTARDGRPTLDLRRKGLTSLPVEISNLTNLRELDLSYNSLTSLRPEIGNLTSLQVLRLPFNQLASLPPEIGNLTNLTGLYLAGNRLVSLPPEIGNLTKLEHLFPYHNRLTSLPPQIGNLASLEVLFLEINRLNSLPVEIGNLACLNDLYLSGNRLTSLPAEIGNLTNLRTLSLQQNQLSSLPSEIRKLNNLDKLGLSDNSLPIPPEILAQIDKPHEIINYYFRHLTLVEKRSLNEAKMILVGQGGTGKTSIVKRLIDGTFNPDEDQTKGIEIRKWPVAVKGENIRVNVWDFGGQEIMHATHQFFLTERSLYLLVLNARGGEHDSLIDYWLKLIRSYGGDSPVIVIVNQVDQQQLHIDKSGFQKKYANIKVFIDTSCKEDTGIEDLEEAIREEISRLEHVKSEWLPGWFAVKTKLERFDENHIPVSAYEKMCDDEDIDALSRKTLLRYLHDLGIVLCFVDDPRLKEKNILNPEWVTGGVYGILNSNIMFQSRGILMISELKEILDSKEYPEDTHPYIIDMMLKFELCFAIEGEKDRYLIPDLLPKEAPDLNWDDADALNFQYHYNVLPGSIISRFIVRARSLISQNTYWRTGVLLKHNGNKAMIKADLGEGRIYISISGKEKTRRELLAIIRSHFDDIHKTIAELEAREMVPVPGHKDVFVEYDYLRDLEDMGEETFVPPRLRERVRVSWLLDGIESPEAREKRREFGRYDERVPYYPSHGTPRPPEKKNNPLILLYILFGILAIIVAELAIVSNYVSWYHMSLILIASLIMLVVFAVIGLRLSGVLSEDSTSGLLKEALKSLSLIRGKSSESA